MFSWVKMLIVIILFIFFKSRVKCDVFQVEMFSRRGPHSLSIVGKQIKK